MTRRTSDGNSWTAWYASQRDEVGTEVFPAFEESKAPHAGLLPTCSNFGQQASTDAVPDSCEACWARLVKP